MYLVVKVSGKGHEQHLDQSGHKQPVQKEKYENLVKVHQIPAHSFQIHVKEVDCNAQEKGLDDGTGVNVDDFVLFEEVKYDVEDVEQSCEQKFLFSVWLLNGLAFLQHLVGDHVFEVEIENNDCWNGEDVMCVEVDKQKQVVTVAVNVLGTIIDHEIPPVNAPERFFEVSEENKVRE